jgi:uncharacterized phiE125 gp8 family phage protein
MTLARITPPAGEPVTLADMKLHLRVTHTSEDGLIGNLIKAAREEVEQATGLALISQGWRLYLDFWPESGVVHLQRTPVISLDEVTVFDTAGTPSSLSLSGFVLDRASRPARLALPDAVTAPSKELNGIEINFTAGFGSTGNDVPDGLKRAIMILAAHWYEHRGPDAFDRESASWPPSFERIINRYRRVGL